MTVNHYKDSLYSFLAIKHNYLIDLKTNKDIIQIMGPWGETKWYKKNDSTFKIEFYSFVTPMTKNKPIAIYQLKVFRDSFLFKRDKGYIGYPSLSKYELNEIKSKYKNPCESLLFQNKTQKDVSNQADRYTTYIAWTAIAIMNGYDEFIEIFNNLPEKNCCGAECNEAYYETLFILNLFELETYNTENGRVRLRKKG